MKQKALVISGCVAAISAPSLGVADVLPDSLVSLNLGEVHSNSFLNEPFKGVIPFLFTSYERSKQLHVSLAPESIFRKVGAEKHPILNQLNFQVTKQDNKPVILISSAQPINLPFLNFILQIKDGKSIVYQDYTVLLDPVSKVTDQLTNVEYFDGNPGAKVHKVSKQHQATSMISPDLLVSLSERIKPSTSNNRLRYKVRRGDSLSQIAQNNNTANTSIELLSRLIYQKNPKAFIRGDFNKIKRGAILNLPTEVEINGFNLVTKNHKKMVVAKTSSESAAGKPVPTKPYTVVEGDSLSSITERFMHEGLSFTKRMNEIYQSNTAAFVNENKNKLKLGMVLNIPDFEENVKVDEVKVTTASIQQQSSKAIKSKAQEQVIAAELDKTIDEGVSETVPSFDTTSQIIENEKTAINGSAIASHLDKQYTVQEGDSLSAIAKKVGHSGVSYTAMLKALFTENPKAFVNGDIAHLKQGAIISLPSLGYFEKRVSENKQPVETVAKNELKSGEINHLNNTESSHLVRRIRQLRKELLMSKQTLSELKKVLNNKELLLDQKGFQLEALKLSILKFKDAPKAVAVSTNITTEMEKLLEQRDQNKYQPKAEAELVKLKRELIEKQANTLTQISQKKAVFASSPLLKVSNAEQPISFENYLLSNILDSTNKKVVVGSVFLLGLVLLHYRRRTSASVYSKIKKDQPAFYKSLKEKEIELNEKRIKEARAGSDYEIFTKAPVAIRNQSDTTVMEKTSTPTKLIEDSTRIYSRSQPEEFVSTQAETPERAIDSKESKPSKRIVINPLLIEAKEDIFAADEKAKEEALELDKCDELVSELFDDSSFPELSKADKDKWDNIEKMCDNALEKTKGDTQAHNIHTPLVNDVDEFNDIMSDLLGGLKKQESNTKINEVKFPISANY